MSGNYNYNSPSKRGNRRIRHLAKASFKPSNTGKPSRVRSAGTRNHK